MKYWQPKFELTTTEERKAYVEQCINSGEYDLTPSTLDRMGQYLIYPIEKEERTQTSNLKPLTNKKKITLEKYKTTGIKYKSSDKPLTKDEKIAKYPETKSYYDLIDLVDRKGKEVLGENGYNNTFDLRVKNPYLAERLKEIGHNTTPKSFYNDLLFDIEDTIQQYKRNVNVTGSGFGRLCGLDDVDYGDPYLIRIIITNYHMICAESRMNPNHIFSLIRLDIEKALLNTDFTMQQVNVLNKILSSNEKLTRPEFKVFYRACERISNFLTNNG